MSSKPVIIGAVAALALSVPFIGSWEGKSNDPYRDIVGVETVCYGETRVDMRRYSDAECTAMLTSAVQGFQNEVLRCTPGLANKPEVLAAATSLAYNIGSRSYCRSTAAKRFNAGNIRGGCDAIKMWNKAGGKVVRGLVNRRNAEYNLCIRYLTYGAGSGTT